MQEKLWLNLSYVLSGGCSSRLISLYEFIKGLYKRYKNFSHSRVVPMFDELKIDNYINWRLIVVHINHMTE